MRANGEAPDPTLTWHSITQNNSPGGTTPTYSGSTWSWNCQMSFPAAARARTTEVTVSSHGFEPLRGTS
jgi:hypothetical protein